MKLLFIGGTGNISAECAELLYNLGSEIGVLTRGRSPVPEEYRAVTADRKSPAEVRRALGDWAPDVVLNFLGYEPADVETDYDLFHGAIRQYIFISSATVYDRTRARQPLTEDAPQGNPAWEYARKKLACEQWLLDRHSRQDFPVTIVRPSHTYSRQWVPNPVSSASYTFAARLESGKPVFVPNDGENPWTLTAASDFALGFAGLVGNPEAIGQAFHITSDEVLTWNQIVAEIAAALNVSNPRVLKVPVDAICAAAPQWSGNLRGDKALPAVFDNSKVKRLAPGFLASKPFRIGIRESVEWLNAAPQRKVIDPQVDAAMDAVVDSWLGKEVPTGKP